MLAGVGTRTVRRRPPSRGPASKALRNGARIASESVGLGSGALSESKSYIGGKDASYSSKSADLVLKPLLSGTTGRTVYRG